MGGAATFIGRIGSATGCGVKIDFYTPLHLFRKSFVLRPSSPACVLLHQILRGSELVMFGVV